MNTDLGFYAHSSEKLKIRLILRFGVDTFGLYMVAFHPTFRTPISESTGFIYKLPCRGGDPNIAEPVTWVRAT